MRRSVRRLVPAAAVSLIAVAVGALTGCVSAGSDDVRQNDPAEVGNASPDPGHSVEVSVDPRGEQSDRPSPDGEGAAGAATGPGPTAADSSSGGADSGASNQRDTPAGEQENGSDASDPGDPARTPTPAPTRAPESTKKPTPSPDPTPSAEPSDEPSPSPEEPSPSPTPTPTGDGDTGGNGGGGGGGDGGN